MIGTLWATEYTNNKLFNRTVTETGSDVVNYKGKAVLPNPSRSNLTPGTKILNYFICATYKRFKLSPGIPGFAKSTPYPNTED